MTSRPDPEDVLFFTTTDELREWFDANHQTAEELWLGYHKKRTGRPTISWSDAVDEALCVGWIDSVRYALDDDRSAQRFTPRRAGSTWSAINVRKVAKLTAQGRMRPAGLAAYGARDPGKTAIYSYEQAEAALSDEETALIRADEAAWVDWQRRAPSYRRTVTHWIVSAKKPETRARRLDALIDASAAGEPVGPMRATQRSVKPAAPRSTSE
ncbi:MAG: YdeI/OmpD-associated family protein [Chloroflexota bacterium]